MKEYWQPILVSHLDEGRGSDLVVPSDLAISIRRFGDYSGITFDCGSIVKLLEKCLYAEGKHGSQKPKIEASWDRYSRSRSHTSTQIVAGLNDPSPR